MEIEVNLLKHQYQFMTSNKPITVMICGRGSGKTFVAGMKIATLLATGKNVIGTAQTYGMVKKVLLKSIEESCRILNLEYEKNISDMTLKVGDATFYGFSAENPEGPRGLTNIKALVMDEAALAPKEMFDITCACLRGQGEPEIYLISTPRGSQNWLSKISEEDNTNLILASTYDNKFLDNSFVKLLESQYDEEFARQELLGEIVNFEGEAQFFKTSMIQAAMRICTPESNWKLTFGVDCARFGGDATAIVVRKGKIIIDYEKLYKTDTHDIVRLVEKMERKHGKPHSIAIDTSGGYGAGPYDILKLTRNNVISCNFGTSSPEEFCQNYRTYIYDLANKYLNEGGLIGNLQELEEELLAQEYVINTRGKKQLKDKSIIKQKLGRSPDICDAFCLSLVTLDNDMFYDHSEEEAISKVLFKYKVDSMNKRMAFKND